MRPCSPGWPRTHGWQAASSGRFHGTRMLAWPRHNSGTALCVNTSAASGKHRVSEVGKTYRGVSMPFGTGISCICISLSVSVSRNGCEGELIYEILLAGSEDILSLFNHESRMLPVDNSPGHEL